MLLILSSGCPTVAAAHSNAPNPSISGVPSTAPGRLLRNGNGLYPRVVRLAHSGIANGTLVASVVDADSGTGVIYRSLDQGVKFTEIGDIRDPLASHGLCCSTLFELPKQIGSMPAGTLLWAASVGQNSAPRRMALDLWRSQDQGATWAPLSACQLSNNTGGLWEPELSVDKSGELACYYSDETSPQQHSQSLQERFSSNGINWSTAYPIVAPNNVALRPGMSIVIPLANGSYYMTYEVCGTHDQYDCAVHFRTSADGRKWGTPTDVGPMITTAAGEYFTHAPFVAWSNNGSLHGRPVLIGQQFRESNGAIAPASGRVMLINTKEGRGSWLPVKAPVAVPSPDASYCPNYSSALLPLSPSSKRLLEIATAYDGKVCKPYYAIGSLPSLSQPLP
ncbi:MAG: exo-alpha-sialidase [Candidatus Dormibacteraceae bacterium]